MQALIFSWLTYIVGSYFLDGEFRKSIYLIGALLTLVSYLSINAYAGSLPITDGLFIVYFYFLFLHITTESNTGYRLLFSTVYLGVLVSFIISYFLNPEISKFIVPLSGLLLIFKRYSSKTDMLIWIIITSLASFSYLLGKEIFYYMNIPFVFYFIRESVSNLFQQLEKEKRRYRDFVDRAINSEIQKQYAELDDELKITYKKLKEIFKLSNYTLSPSEIEDIAERVVEGLHNLGYSGVVLYVNFGNYYVFKKSGFFPYVKNYLEEKFEKINKITISDDEKHIFLPLKSDKEKIGVLGVYKKEGISPKEIEYLSTYANSVAISITKTIYFKEINKLQELLEKTFESVDIGIAIINKDFKIERANKALENITGKKPEGDIFEIVPEIQPLKEEIKQVIQNKKTIDTILSSINRKGSIYRIKALPLISSDNVDVDKVVIVIEDVTEKENLEAQLLETEKHAVIGKMAAGLSHDIKNPLAAISASAFAIKKRGETLEDGKIIELAKKIEKNSSRAAEIINRLLNYAKPSYYKAENVDLKETLISSIDFAIPDSKKKDIKIHKRLKSGVYTYGDKSALQQIFINILINAAEAMNHKGKIEIKLSKNEQYAVVSIKDTGPGIPEDLIEEIFDPFFTTKEKGTGLGLSVVNRIVKDHSGKIEVISKEGEGTEFIIKLPLSED
ncbi:ATP-binding protein [Persephonella sp.]|uniref:ATP-binding protein n=1 Tax=Persephonella sp. TaxID=2060922 RepID=UPI0025E29959|nr:ATP-binding protein [Persephonella sp.]